MAKLILTYKNKGSKRAGGQQVGAEGSGTFAVVFNANNEEQAYAAARDYMRNLDEHSEYPDQINEIHIVYGEGYYGPMIKEIEVNG